ncbi:hypothetical protein [Novosphingobium sp.]|uniref:hypothetical protein n=1 Tax=Novosphingobium sp. TaxID=1874826 RepID=UPI0028A9751E|nr:hypothetical protein [Novosphingobium sp.]
MKMALVLSALVGLLPTVAIAAQSEVINLECRGRAETVEYGDTDLVTGQEDVVRLQLSGAAGVAELPRLIGGKKHKALRIASVVADSREINGKVWYGGIGNAKLHIDRIAGLISIRGPQGNFSGTCTKFDPNEPPKPAF